MEVGAMGEIVAAEAIRVAIDAAERAKVAIEELADHEVAASVETAVNAASFDLHEALRRLGR
jgi:hypothetical protein